MIAEFGQICLILALLVALAQSIIPMAGAAQRDLRLMKFGDSAAIAQFLLIALAFGALTTAFVTSDFSVQLAAQSSHTDKPLLYKITGVWGNHEGSMMLWVLILALFGALVPVFGKTLPASLKARALSVQAMIGVGFIAFILFTSNPFLRLDPAPLQGAGLNPILQDPGLAFHPPFLYLGYVGFSMSFSFSVAALIEGRVDAVWARWLRPWVLLAWSFLTIGITLGSVWAYYELGWGGWWMWDPVENVSFMPWLIGTALLHSIMVLGTRHSMASWTILLGIAAFSLSLVGTFVVRSGVLVSVHSFAVDPARGVMILILLMLTTGGALALYALRANSLKSRQSLAPVSREGGLALNNMLLIAAAGTVFLGTFYPLFMDIVSENKISVGKPYFDLTFAPIMLILIIFMAIGPLMKWRKANLKPLKPFFIKAAILMGVIIVATALIGKSVLGGIALALSAYLALATLLAFGKKLRWGQISRAESFKLLRRQSAASYGFLLAHLGLAIFTAGATIMSVWAKDDITRLKIGESLNVAGYAFTLDRLTPGQRDNFEYLSADISISKNSEKLTVVNSERRYYPARQMVTSEAGFRLSFGPTLFAAIGEGDSETGFIVRAYYHPFIVWIWIGALMMALAGFVSMADRRLRAPKHQSEVGSENV